MKILTFTLLFAVIYSSGLMLDGNAFAQTAEEDEELIENMAPNPPDGSTSNAVTQNTTTTATAADGSSIAYTTIPETDDTVNEPISLREEYEGEAVETKCPTSTCITPEIVAFADHIAVNQDKLITNFPNIIGEEECLPPISTGNIVIKQISGGAIKYADNFCRGTGCSFIQAEGCL